MEKLYFTRLFVSGTLKGIVHHDSIPFVSVERAMEWYNKVNEPKMVKRNEYKIIDRSFQNYNR